MPTNLTPPKVLSIAGFDGSCGAGLQADLKTFSALRCYGLTVLTSLPIQNTQGVRSIFAIPPATVAEQLHCQFDDVQPTAIKIGMLFNAAIIETVAAILQERAPDTPVVLDPVMVAKSGDHLLLPDAVAALKENLLPRASVITPNLPEASVLIGQPIRNEAEMGQAAQQLLTTGCRAVLLKGGHLDSARADDYYCDQQGNRQWLPAARVTTRHTHGTGCTLSAAIAASLAHGQTPLHACQSAKHYTLQALRQADHLQMGRGHGALHHFWALWT